jgi:hypothetical protein
MPLVENGIKGIILYVLRLGYLCAESSKFTIIKERVVYVIK